MILGLLFIFQAPWIFSGLIEVVFLVASIFAFFLIVWAYFFIYIPYKFYRAYMNGTFVPSYKRAYDSYWTSESHWDWFKKGLKSDLEEIAKVINS